MRPTVLRSCPHRASVLCDRNVQTRQKKCRYCGSRLIERFVFFGVFVWRGDGRYPAEDALWTYSRLPMAENRLAREARDDLVVREIPAWEMRDDAAGAAGQHGDRPA